MTVTALERQLFGYDAVNSTPRRTAPTANMRTEDELLPGMRRDTLVSTSRDAKRNFAIAAWMIRKHMDFVASFSFKANTPNREFNQRYEKFIRRWSKRANCHVAKRHPLRRLIRMMELNRTLDGDLLIELMKSGALNLIRGDRIRNPRGLSNNDEWTHGIRSSLTTQELLEFQIHRRQRSGRFIEEKRIPARNAIHHGYFDDSEQFRGVSPLSTALNSLRDTYEGIDYALVRLKAEMILGIAITKDPDVDVNPFVGNKSFEVRDEEDEDLTDEEKAELQQQQAEEESERGVVDYGKGLFQWELRKGEDVKSIGGTMPSSNAQNFLQVVINIALKALDLPYSFYAEDFTNFVGARGALQLYKRSAQNKQADNQDVLDEITFWRSRQAVIENHLELPRGWKLEDVETLWVPTGIPWWDRSKEVIGDIRAIAAGLDNPQNVCLEHGTGTYEGNLELIREAALLWTEMLGEFNLPIGFASVGNVAAGTGQTPAKKDDK